MSDIQIFIQDKDNEGEWRDIDEGLLDLSLHDAKVRAAAIDDFVRFASTMPTVEEKEYIRGMSLEEMAEKLKEGGENENYNKEES